MQPKHYRALSGCFPIKNLETVKRGLFVRDRAGFHGRKCNLTYSKLSTITR